MSNQKLEKEYDEGNVPFITAEQLKSKLDSNEPLMIFDIGDMQRYNRQHIPGSACAVCNEDSKRNIMPKLPKNIELVLVGDNDEYPMQMAAMMSGMGLNASYLKGGIKSWKWGFKDLTDKNISPKDLKEGLDNRRERFFLLDVREPSEFEQWNIPNSTNISLSELLSKQESLDKIPKEKTIVTICPHGNRSTIAKYLLERYGYSVRSLEGGLKAWSASFEQAYKEFQTISGKNMRLVQFRRIGKGCMSYILESNGDAVVIDPVFPIEEYIKTANEDLNTKITKVFDTHQHADHVSAAKALAERTNADLCQSFYEDYHKVDTEAKGPTARYNQVRDGDFFKVGVVKIKAIHTPGHTTGSISLLVEKDTDDDNNNNSSNETANLELHRSLLLFTGDVLFVNGIGRPDLHDRTQEFAELLYDTLHNKIMSLPKDTLILPGHFDYDLKIGELVTSTIEDIKKNNILLNYQKQDFIRNIASKATPTPPNYKEIISINNSDRELPTLSEIYELEIGPNRCSLSNSSNTSSIGDISANSRIKNNYAAKIDASSVSSNQS
jgi:glyoxylase-like metal-dependent hydrolase (beta-lactamase superfamily II)/rhodanese-related sulfurtransferase